MTVTIHRLEVTCEACPVQIEGVLSNGWFIYGRERFNTWQVGAGTTMEAAVTATFAGDGLAEEGDGDGESEYDTGSVEDLVARMRRFVGRYQPYWSDDA